MNIKHFIFIIFCLKTISTSAAADVNKAAMTFKTADVDLNINFDNYCTSAEISISGRFNITINEKIFTLDFDYFNDNVTFFIVTEKLYSNYHRKQVCDIINNIQNYTMLIAAKSNALSLILIKIDPAKNIVQVLHNIINSDHFITKRYYGKSGECEDGRWVTYGPNSDNYICNIRFAEINTDIFIGRWIMDEKHKSVDFAAMTSGKSTINDLKNICMSSCGGCYNVLDHCRGDNNDIINRFILISPGDDRYIFIILLDIFKGQPRVISAAEFI